MRRRGLCLCLTALLGASLAEPLANAQPASGNGAPAPDGGVRPSRRAGRVMQERRIEGRTSNLEKKAGERAQAQRQDQVALQIPAALLDHVLEHAPEQERLEGWNMQ